MKGFLFLITLTAVASCTTPPAVSEVVKADVEAHQTPMGLSAAAQEQANFWR